MSACVSCLSRKIIGHRGATDFIWKHNGAAVTIQHKAARKQNAGVQATVFRVPFKNVHKILQAASLPHFPKVGNRARYGLTP